MFKESIQREVIVHELLHVLSLSKIEENNITTYKVGLEINQISQDKLSPDTKWIYTNDKILRSFGKGINEGITQLLTEQILGLDTNINIGYQEEKDITRVLKALFGEEYLIEKYFKPIKSGEEIKDPIDYIFDQKLESKMKYKWEQRCKVLEEVLVDFNRLATLKYNFHSVFQEDQKKFFLETKAKIETNLKILSKFTLELTSEDEIDEKLKNLLKSFRDYHSERINYFKNTKLKLNFNGHKTANALQKILINENSEMQLGEMVYNYLRLTHGTEREFNNKGYLYKEWKDSVENYCIKKGIINESEVRKSGMLSLILQYQGLDLKNMKDEEFKKILSEFTYTKLGSHYEISYNADSKLKRGFIEGMLFDDDGKTSSAYGMFPAADDEWTSNTPPWDYEYDIEKAENIRVQVENIAKNSERRISRAMVLGDDVVLYYGNNIKNRIAYSLNENGELILAEEGVFRRITDDMSELDIKLKEETADVSIKEMLQEADSMQIILGDKTQKTNEYLKKDENGK